MTSLASWREDLSVITLSDPQDNRAAWRTLGWPAEGSRHLTGAFTTRSDRARWAAKLDRAVTDSDRSVLLIASGLSCFAVGWWAKLSPANYAARVAGALLFAPGDAREDLRARFAAPRIAMPFSSLVIDQALTEKDAELQRIAADWGSGLVRTRERPEQEGGSWQQAQRLFRRFTNAVVENDVRRVSALQGLRSTG
ncbi:alpha/beta hydrolase [Sphingomonas sp. PL-96]|uniref:alpha/beta hydrolase n=1 Tax=Sphingomonas sp. PL-96 TaxID=2887201 RepID=UPI001E5E7D56|nr:alpha/beta hydrolase [Sphingomonas sp. PL-96]MCC2976784.1 alpha/beta hydrolase [Sphingomonas sp. PL-96]